MSDAALVHRPAHAVRPHGHDDASALVAAFLAARSPRTLAAYRGDLADFAGYLEAPSIDHAAAALLTRTQGDGNALVLAYRSALARRGLASATINRRLAALRSLVKLGRMLGKVGWAIDVENLCEQPYRDTRGPDLEQFRRLVRAASGEGAKATRDRALLFLLFNPALRRGEVASLDLAHLEDAGEKPALWVLGKGKRRRERVELPPTTAKALRAWIRLRGTEAGPLFTPLDRARKGDGRLTGTAIYQLVRSLGKKAGLARVRPHGLRHGGITEFLEASSGNVREARAFSRHAKLDTLQRYDDNRQNLGGRAARRLDTLLEDLLE